MKRFLLSLLFLLPILGFSQQYKLTIDSIHQPMSGTCNQLEFDIYIQNVGTNTLKLSGFQAGINFNYAGMCNGGNISAMFVPGSSYNPTTNTQLPSPQNSCNWYVSQTSHQIRCLAALVSSSSAAATIPTTAPGLKLGTLRLTNTVAFAQNVTPDFVWSFVTAANQTKTGVSAWVNGSTAPVNLTTQTSFSYSNQGPECYINGNPSISGSTMNVNITSQVYPESCYLSGNGAINVTVSPAGYYSYHWSNGNSSEDLMNVTSGSYTLTLQNSNGECASFTDTVTFSGINCGTIVGNVFLDNNNDCILNGNDVGAENIHVTLSNGAVAITNSNGDYFFNAINYGDYGIQISPNSYFTTNTCLQPDSVHISSSQPFDSSTFKVLTGITGDMGISLSGQTLVPGFSRLQTIKVKNYADSATLTTVSYVLNSSLIIDSITPGYTLYSTSLGDSLVWNISFLPFEEKTLKVKTLVPASTPLGLSFTFRGHVVLIGQVDLYLTNNNYTRTVLTNGSYDPNDKQVNPIGMGPNGIIELSDSMLDYTIQFQNTGTSEAINISIMDTLSNKLDWNSLEVLSASHPYMILVPTPGVIQFKFNNILLPDSNTNEPLSHGYICYRIKQKNTNVLGDVILNKADITFDFNAPVVTNTTINTLGSLNPLGLHEAVEILPEIYPNPAHNEITITYNSVQQPMQLELFDVTGRKVFFKSLPTGKNKELVILPSQLSEGVYQYRFSSSDKMIRTGKLEVRR